MTSHLFSFANGYHFHIERIGLQVLSRNRAVRKAAGGAGEQSGKAAGRYKMTFSDYLV